MREVRRKDQYLDEIIQALDIRLEQAKGDVFRAWKSLSKTELEFIDNELVRILEFRYYLENYHVIPTEYEGLKTMYPMWESQEIFYLAVEELQAAGKQVKVLVLKARQLGLSTICEALVFHRTFTTPVCNALIVAQDPGQSDYLFSMSRLAYDYLPWWMKPEKAYEAKGKYLVFDRENPIERQQNPGLRSAIFVEAANKLTGVARGKTIRAAHLSELASWPDGTIWIEQISPAMNAPDAMALGEGTAEGRDNWFYDLWVDAVEGKIPWKPVFIEFFRVKKYFLPIPEEKRDQFKLTAEEQALRSKVQREKGVTVTDEQFNWRRDKMQEFITVQKNEWRFYKEFPGATWMEAFQGTGLCAFNKRKLQYMMEATACPPRWFGDLTLKPGTTNQPKITITRTYDAKTGEYVRDAYIPPQKEYGSRLYLWEKPIPGEVYYIGGDVAHGVVGGDFSVAQVIKLGRGREPDVQVAEWRGWINPTPFAHVLAALGYWFNTAQIAVELNDCGKTTNVELMRVLGYENVYQYKHVDKIKNFLTDFWGWVTNFNTRDLLMTGMREAIDEDTLVIKSEGLLDEMMDFAAPRPGARYEGQSLNDDRIMSMMICRYCAHDSDWALEMKAAPRESPDPNKDFQNTEFSPLYSKNSMRAEIFRERKVPADKILYEEMHMFEPTAEQMAEELDWRNI